MATCGNSTWSNEIKHVEVVQYSFKDKYPHLNTNVLNLKGVLCAARAMLKHTQPPNSSWFDQAECSATHSDTYTSWTLQEWASA